MHKITSVHGYMCGAIRQPRFGANWWQHNLTQLCKGRGRHFVLLLPASAPSWQVPALRALRSMPGCLQAVGTFRDGGGTSVTLRILTSSQAVVSTFLAAQRDAQLDALPPDCGLQRCYYHEVLAEETEMDGAGEEEDLSDDDLGEPYVGDITPAIRNAVRRVHEATGHRSPRRL